MTLNRCFFFGKVGHELGTGHYFSTGGWGLEDLVMKTSYDICSPLK